MNLRRIYAQALISRLNKITPQPGIITFVNQTSRSGRFVTTMNVGYGLALRGKTVLIIDLSLHTQVNSPFGLSSYFALTMETANALPFLDEYIPAGSLEIIPGDEKLSSLERETHKRIDKNLLLRNLLFLQISWFLRRHF